MNTAQHLLALKLLNPGCANGEILKLSAPLSFWGGFDPKDGRILDQSHPQVGISIAGKILALSGSRGSAGTPAGIAEALRLKTGPIGILLFNPDVNITIGIQVADYLYETHTPVLLLDAQQFDDVKSGMNVEINDAKMMLKLID